MKDNRRPHSGMDADVIVLGYGPTGKVLSILLAQQGHRVAIVDRWPDIYPLPRAVHYDDEVSRILQACGVSDKMRHLVEPVDFYTWVNADREILLNLDQRNLGVSGWPEGVMFSQPDLERVLFDRAKELSEISFHTGWVATDLVTSDHRAQLTIREVDRNSEAGAPLDGGRTQTLTAPWIVGCDGANSFVRRSLGIGQMDLGFDAEWLVVDIKLNRPKIFQPKNLQLCDPARPTTAVSGGPGRRRWEFMLLPGETREQILETAKIWRLLEPWDVTPENCTLERAAAYRFQATLAARWRQGQALLAGDAAHTTPPFAGQGMCAGVRDAAALAWRLDLVLKEVSSAELLDSYQSERAAHVRELIDFAIELGKVICISDPAAAAERDRVMKAQIADKKYEEKRRPRLGSGLWDADAAEAGYLALQAECEVDGRRGLQDDLLGIGYTLIHRSGLALPEECDTGFKALGGRFVDVGKVDVTGAYAAWLDEIGADAVLVRPDFYIQGTSSGDQVAQMLNGAVQQLVTGRASPADLAP